MLHIAFFSRTVTNSLCYTCKVVTPRCSFSDFLYSKYTDGEKNKILQVINDSDTDALSRYDISKSNLKKIIQFRKNNGNLDTPFDIEHIEGISGKSATKFFNSILNGQLKEKDISNKIKGQFLHPNLSQSAIENCKSVLSVYVTVNSVCWTQINKENYEVVEWKYYSIDYPESRRLLITDILNIAWSITQKLPLADIYVMKAEATTLRASGSDPNNPKVLAINLQKSQMVSMLVALITARSNQEIGEESEGDDLKQNVYFLRPTLPYRLYGTLVGNEKVSTEQTIEMLLNGLSDKSSSRSHAYVPQYLQEMYRSQRDLQKDMLGHCLLLSLTFMDLCIYKNKERIAKLVKGGAK